MIFVFEDNENDLLSRLFKAAYPSEKADNFVFVKGNGEFKRKVQELLENREDRIAVFMDVIPDNIFTAQLYDILRNISKRNNDRVIVFPLVCSEYYFVKSIVKYPSLFKTFQGVDFCVNKKFYANSPLLNDDKSIAFAKNFEKYCKLVLLKHNIVIDCIRHSRGEHNENYRYGDYYFKDCLCEHCDDTCSNKSLIQKSLDYVAEFPCVPSGTLVKIGRDLDLNDLWAIHKRLVVEYNEMCEQFITCDPLNRSKYKFIKTII